MKKTTVYALATLLSLLPVSSAYALSLKDIEGEIMCICPDNCGKVLINCNCKYSDAHRAGIIEQIKSGMNKKQIVDAWVVKYGEKGLATPTKEGFNIMAWIMPFLALFLAGGLVFFLVKRWTLTKGDAGTETAHAKFERISGTDKKILADIENELKNFDQ